MRVMVTGSGGYLGSVLSLRLAQQGLHVVPVDAGFFGKASDTSSSRRDIRDLSGEDFDGVDAVVHLAALSNDACADIDVELSNDINARQPVRLAEAARRFGIERFVFASTCSVYGAAADRPVAEDSPVNPLSVYADTKHRAERGISELASRGFTPVVLRFATLFGASPSMRTDLSINRMTASAVTRGRVDVFGGGVSFRPFLHVRDAVAAIEFALAAEAPAVAHRYFNVAASNGNLRLCEVAEVIREVVSGVEVAIRRDHYDARNYLADCGRLAAEGVRFETDFHHEIAALANYFADQGRPYESLIAAPADRACALSDLMATRTLDQELRWTSTPLPATRTLESTR